MAYGGDFGERLKNLRKAAGMTQQELADKLNVHLQTVSKWERGVSEPDISQLGEISSALGLSLEKLLGEEDGERTYTGDFSAARLGGAIFSVRSEAGESQERLAEIIGVSSDAVSRWERGITCPDIDAVKRLAAHFGLPVSKLYYGVFDAPPQAVAVRRGAKGRLPVIVLSAALVIVVAVAALLPVLLPRYAFPPATGLTDEGSSDTEVPGEGVPDDDMSDGDSAANMPQQIQITVDGECVLVWENQLFMPEVPVRDGYDFTGWEDGDGIEVTFPMLVEEGDVFYAQFVPHEYSIEYWLNGGYFEGDAPRAINVESGSVELPAPKKQGQTFEGWYLSSDYSGGAVERVECGCADIVLYAKWSTAVFTVKYELNGGILYGRNPSSVTAEESVELSEPVREGYIFLGWFDSEEGGERYESVGGRNASNLTLYALWQRTDELFTVLYELNGGTPEGENPASVGAGEVHKLWGASREGYDFVGWNDMPDGSGNYYQSLYGITGDLTLYAVFTPRVYLVRYVYEGIYEGQSANPNYITYGEEVELLPVWLYGHEFAGWYTAEEGGSKVTVINKENIADITTLYARFEPLEYTITLDANGGSLQTAKGAGEQYTFILRFGQSVELPVPEYGGYEFLGWENKSGEYISRIDSTNICDMTLTAEWRPTDVRYNITYVLDGGVLEEENPQSVLAGQVVPLNEPVRTDYIFLGWYDNAGGTGKRYYSTPADRSADLTLYAIWQRVVVNGDYRDFTYQKDSSSVVITSYTGAYGEDIDLVIPSVIDGLPVTALGTDEPYATNHNGWPQSIFGESPVFRSVTIPEGVTALNACVFFDITVLEPVRIPSAVTYIGKDCFAYFNGEVRFSYEGNLKRIGEGAFHGVTFRGTLEVPYGVEVLESGALYGVHTTGIILPHTVEVIMADALYQPNGYVQQVFIPSSVKYLASYTGTVYTDMSEEEITSLYGEPWGPIYADICAGTVTLNDGENTQTMSGYAFDLPVAHREGYTFLGWQDESGQFVPDCYIPGRDAVLTAVYEEKCPSDGRTAATAATVEAGKAYEYIAVDGQNFYFSLSGLNKCKIAVSVSEGRAEIYRYRNQSCEYVQNGGTIDYLPGDCFAVYAEHIAPGTKITIRIMAL